MEQMGHSSLNAKLQGTSSRILYDIPCKVCQDHSSGKHYGIFACDGCAGFFKRSIRRNRQYVCKAKGDGTCLVDKTHRNQCRACRLRKCLEAGMNRDAVQHERGPRNSTLRRQILMMKEEPSSSASPTDLTMPNLSASPQRYFYPPPSIVETEALSEPESICETAARLLFMNVRWARHVPAFTTLNMKDQVTLLEESWRELFLLGWAQLLPPTDLTQLIALRSTSVDAQPSSLIRQAALFQECLAKLRSLTLDHHEFACLRAVLLFKTALEGEGKSLVDVAGVAALQDQTSFALSKYISTSYPDQPYRLGKLLLALPELRSVSPRTIEEMFFRRTIGPVTIERIICDMYKSNGP
ncbi:nuclear receptor subfamily 2 group E member tailless [Rhodnius prolixus]|uniref:nuclear receptor subfamily 2 group E member tailless n=1 Tax=Rhodnius prolixus TaxID=13249 RepID=UPI003D18B8C6